jgi:glutamine synthetase
MLTLAQLQTLHDAQAIDTVIVCSADMQGRLVGKRLTSRYFLEHVADSAVAACDYLLTLDLAMEAVEGFASSNWEQGYGDFYLRPDTTTLRVLPWAAGTAWVMCDLTDRDGQPIALAPRTMLKRQLAKLAALGYAAQCATELEFYLFTDGYAQLYAENYRELRTLGHFNADYQIFQTEVHEPLMRQIRNQLTQAGIEVEGSMGECSPGQQELNLRYCDMLSMADSHILAKTAIKTLAQQHGHSASFLAKWHQDYAGSSSHIHVSLWDAACRTSLFLNQQNREPEGQDVSNATSPEALGMSPLMQHFVAGLLNHTQEAALFYCPYVNSYRRFVEGSFAPSALVWAVDNRSAAFRLCAPQSKAIRIENRLPGSDANPYLAFTLMLAAGLAGIEAGLPLPPAAQGNLYRGAPSQDAVPHWPHSLTEAIALAQASEFLRLSLGADVAAHYLHAAKWEASEFAKNVFPDAKAAAPEAISAWEIARGFERC